MQGNRGKRLEQLIDLFGYRYQSIGRAYLIKSPPPVKHIRSLKNGQFVGCYAKKGQPDYMLLADGDSYLFDAKEFKGRRFPFASLHRHQFDALVRWSECGGVSGLLVCATEMSAYWFIPVETFKSAYMAWIASRSIKGPTPKGKASLSVEWMAENGIPWGEDGYLSALITAKKYPRLGEDDKSG